MRKQKNVRHWTVSRNIQFKKLSNTQKSIANFKQDFLYFSYYSWLTSFVTVLFPSLIRGWLLLHYMGPSFIIWNLFTRTQILSSPILHSAAVVCQEINCNSIFFSCNTWIKIPNWTGIRHQHSTHVQE